MATVQGIAALERRLRAIGEPRPVLKALQIATVSEAQARVPRKTGHLQRSIRPGRLTDDYAVVEAKTPYAEYVEKGTGIYGPRRQKIVPKKAKVLAWRTNTRLSGRARVSGSGWAFAQSVRGRKATPYLIPGAKAAVQKGGLRGIIIGQWNRAA